ncbi:MAG: elongation factor 3 [Rhodospirillaceae bacterium TMED167]|nr:elongation factor 3 [Rhodospirillaceae bacterium]OUW27709.1 MAG: elongation factor 3 [Rhodospirillaceae bacterium TMED167]
MASPLLTLKNVSLSFGHQPLLDQLELAVSVGDRICLVGRNGSGKSTLLKIIAGQIEPDQGTRFLQPGTTLRYLPQEPDFSGFQTSLSYVEAGLALGDDPYRARYLLEQLSLTGEEDLSTMSGGEARRCALAASLAPAPDILLLDEPTNHLDVSSIEWLEAQLGTLKTALILISHDRRFLRSLSRTTLWIDRGEARRLENGFGGFEAWRDKIFEQEETERHKLDRKIHRETHWLIHGVTARRKRNQRRLSDLHALRENKRTLRTATGDVKLTVSEAGTSGKRVIEVEDISKAYGDRVIVNSFSARILRGDRVGIVGPNGAGKTTLLNMLIGKTAPDEGSAYLGSAVELAALDQRREALKPAETLSDVLTGGRGDMVTVNGQQKHVIGYMKDFLFAPEQAGTPVRELSGGERGRLVLAEALARPSNLLVLDEPTNDLDLETLDLLQEMLTEYPGTVLLVSHDRDFLDRVATSIIASDGAGGWLEYAGGYSDMEAQRGADITASRSLKAATKSANEISSSAPVEKAKLSYKDVYALETLPGQIADLECTIADCHKTLADPDLFKQDPDRYQKSVDALQAAETALAKLEDRWLELEMKREEIEGA